MFWFTPKPEEIIDRYFIMINIRRLIKQTKKTHLRGRATTEAISENH